MLPAAAQGVIGIECLAHRQDLIDVLSLLQDDTAKITTRAERAVASELDAGCHSPLASYATLADGKVTLAALVAAADGSHMLRHTATAAAEDAAPLGYEVAQKLLDMGAGEYLR